jgi:hypothetical protein
MSVHTCKFALDRLTDDAARLPLMTICIRSCLQKQESTREKKRTWTWTLERYIEVRLMLDNITQCCHARRKWAVRQWE